MQVSVTVSTAGSGSRLGRLPFVLLLTVGLLLSLIHCAGCDLGFTNTNATDRGDEPRPGLGAGYSRTTVAVPQRPLSFARHRPACGGRSNAG